MNKVEVGTDNIYFEMESKKGSEARTYDEVSDKNKTPPTIEACAQEAKKKGQPAKDVDTVAFSPMLLIVAAVVAVAFLTAVATLVLALTMMLSRNNSTASNDCTDVNGANLASELKEMKENNSYVQSLLLAAVENLKIRMRGIEGKLSSTGSSNSSNRSYIQGDNCPKPKNQANDTFRPTSCLDYLSRGDSICGMYKLYDNAGNSYPAYCDLKSEPGTAWTLVMSWANMHRALPSFRNVPFSGNAPVNENAQNWNLYRLSLARMRSLQAHSTHWRATCSYPTYGVDFRDYVRGNFRDFNVVDFSGSGQCMKVEFVNIRGHMGVHLKARVWQRTSYLWHISDSGCQFDPTPDSVSSEDNFGYYFTINPKFRCNEGPHSTTQWWFGAHL